jgi:glycosyltransferase involved in cell wall biosynthesis
MISVIIPSFNRSNYLRETLSSLVRQVYLEEYFEVIVVDDGSTDDTATVAGEEYPFSLRYIWQENSGDAAARNRGVEASRGELLVFLDDDVLAAPDYLFRLREAHRAADNRIVVGAQRLWLTNNSPSAGYEPRPPREHDTLHQIHFADLCSNNMSILRSGYLSVGAMENFGFAGSSMWCDVDFAYRAHRRGFQFLQSSTALCWHRDYTVRNLEARARRGYESAYRGVRLLQRHPDLLPELPMFRDMTPVNWRQDRPLQLLRKLLRVPASSRPALGLLARLLQYPDAEASSSRLRSSLEKWLVGGHIYRGFRRGMREFGVR